MFALAFAALVFDFPLEEEVKTELKNEIVTVEFICKVSKVGDSYIYFYSIKNKSKENVKVKWETLNKALKRGFGNDFLLELAAGENINVVLENTEPPEQVFQFGSVFKTVDTETFSKNLDAKVSKGKVSSCCITGHIRGAIPK